MLNTNKLLLSILIGGLVGCVSLPTKFDSNEYMHLVYLDIASDSQTGCNRIENESILFYSKFLYRYSKHTANDNIVESYEQLYNWANELSSKESPSDAYCNIKKKNINSVTTQALEVYGARIK